MKLHFKKALSIYATIGIPLLYLYNIFLAYTYPNTLRISIPLRIFGLFLTLFGLTMWIVSYMHLGFSFGVLPQKQKKVIKGLYHYLNHPMYAAVYLTFLGLSLVNASLQGVLFLLLIMTPLLFIRAAIEEKKLQ